MPVPIKFKVVIANNSGQDLTLQNLVSLTNPNNSDVPLPSGSSVTLSDQMFLSVSMPGTVFNNWTSSPVNANAENFTESQIGYAATAIGVSGETNACISSSPLAQSGKVYTADATNALPFTYMCANPDVATILTVNLTLQAPLKGGKSRGLSNGAIIGIIVAVVVVIVIIGFMLYYRKR